MSPWTAVKIVAAGAICFWFYHLGGEAPKLQLVQWQQRQAELTAKAVLAERNSSQQESNRLTAVVAEYEKASLAPVDPGIVHRVFLYAASGCGPLPKAPATPSGTQPASGVRPSSAEVEQATAAVFDAGHRDALRLNLCRQAWPR